MCNMYVDTYFYGLPPVPPTPKAERWLSSDAVSDPTSAIVPKLVVPSFLPSTRGVARTGFHTSLPVFYTVEL